MFGRLYRILLWLALPVLLLRLEWRAGREPEYGRRIGERFGRVPPEAPSECLWFHAVSAGEAIAAAPLIAALAAAAPVAGRPFLVTSTTPAGSAEIRHRLPGLSHCYAPYDFPFAVRAFFRRVRPRLLALVETELWPNLIDEAQRRGVPVVAINARLSERSARRYALMRGLTRRMLAQMRFIACQHEEDAARFRALGAAADKVAAFGSIKFDAVLPESHAAQVAALGKELRLLAEEPDGATAGGAPGPPPRVWLAGSTHSGEDEIVLEAHREVRRRLPSARLLLAPRHPVRAAAICALAQRMGFAAKLLGAMSPQAEGCATGDGGRQFDGGGNTKGAARASRGDGDGARGQEGWPSPPEVVVCDIMGQLQTLYGLSEIAFLGGSLVPAGGHNPIEAALCGQPLLAGPHTFNFSQVMAVFAEAGCLTRVRTAGQLAEAVLAGLRNEGRSRAAGRRALQAVADHRGATARLLDFLGREIRAAAGCDGPRQDAA